MNHLLPAGTHRHRAVNQSHHWPTPFSHATLTLGSDVPLQTLLSHLRSPFFHALFEPESVQGGEDQVCPAFPSSDTHSAPTSPLQIDMGHATAVLSRLESYLTCMSANHHPHQCLRRLVKQECVVKPAVDEDHERRMVQEQHAVIHEIKSLFKNLEEAAQQMTREINQLVRANYPGVYEASLGRFCLAFHTPSSIFHPYVRPPCFSSTSSTSSSELLLESVFSGLYVLSSEDDSTSPSLSLTDPRPQVAPHPFFSSLPTFFHTSLPARFPLSTSTLLLYPSFLQSSMLPVRASPSSSSSTSSSLDTRVVLYFTVSLVAHSSIPVRAETLASGPSLVTSSKLFFPHRPTPRSDWWQVKRLHTTLHF
eukprot:TRINITY_DN4184_c0_g1_i13.p1 TRINITY_DN4184_c0_g1~~TRINITY_DN4184_c0_g1_i13.p1  ORF type:complete len:365 (+),score=39.93 TRINITY_DN4184_c0_g1_i13:537-1631(+)